VKVLAVVPAHDEEPNLRGLVDEIRRHRPELEILVVDDHSRDGTPETLAGLGVRWLRLPQHLGLGGAIRAGLRYARQLGYDTVVRLDGDGQHRPDQLEHLLVPLRRGEADAVQGSRYAGAASHRSRRMRRAGQYLLAPLLSLVVGRRVTDPTSGFWAFGPRAVRLLSEHHPTGYPEPELLLLLSRNGLRVVEVPIEMRERSGGRSSLTIRRAGVALARVVLAVVIVPLRARVEVIDGD
jgi:hypothetical protein